MRVERLANDSYIKSAQHQLGQLRSDLAVSISVCVSAPAGMCVSMKEFDDNSNKLPESGKPRQPFSVVSKSFSCKYYRKSWATCCDWLSFTSRGETVEVFSFKKKKKNTLELWHSSH